MHEYTDTWVDWLNIDQYFFLLNTKSIFEFTITEVIKAKSVYLIYKIMLLTKTTSSDINFQHWKFVQQHVSYCNVEFAETNLKMISNPIELTTVNQANYYTYVDSIVI